MKTDLAKFNCGEQLLNTLAPELREVESAVDAIKWSKSFTFTQNGITYEHQTAYNKAFAAEFTARGWEMQPVFRREPRLIGDFRKGLVFVEVQFGNSATLYRDYYKFQYGLANGLLSMAVLIVSVSPAAFFPTRKDSVNNMADFAFANRCLTVLPINVPTILIGLLAGA